MHRLYHWRVFIHRYIFLLSEWGVWMITLNKTDFDDAREFVTYIENFFIQAKDADYDTVHLVYNGLVVDIDCQERTYLIQFSLNGHFEAMEDAETLHECHLITALNNIIAHNKL